MTHNALLAVTSLISIALAMIHVSEDVARGIDAGGTNMMIAVVAGVVWLYGTLVLAGRRSGYIIMLLGAIVGTGVPIVHMIGSGMVGGRIAGSSGILLWVSTLMIMQMTSIFSGILAIRGLWDPRWGLAVLGSKAAK